MSDRLPVITGAGVGQPTAQCQGGCLRLNSPRSTTAKMCMSLAQKSRCLSGCTSSARRSAPVGETYCTQPLFVATNSLARVKGLPSFSSFYRGICHAALGWHESGPNGGDSGAAVLSDGTRSWDAWPAAATLRALPTHAGLASAQAIYHCV